MKPEEAAYIRYRMAQAEEALEDARSLMSSGSLRAAVNRLYYACFYAATALLYSEGLSAKKHGGVLSLFNRHFVKTGLVPVETGRFLSAVFDRRLQGDYGFPADFEEDDVRTWLGQSASLVTQVGGRVEERLRDASGDTTEE